MIIAAIDPSLAKAGYAVLGVPDTAISYGHTELRTGAQVDYLVNVLAAFRPDVVAIESTYMSKINMKTGMDLAELRGRLRQSLEMRGIPVVLVAPSTWRKVLEPPAKAKRATLKKMAVAYVASRYGLKVTDDEADAIVLAEFVRHANA